MKQVTFAGLFALAIVLMFSTCKKDPCKDVVCLNGGTCIIGICDCITGYEGDDCGTESRAKVIGTYSVTDNCSSSGGSTYTVVVTVSSTDVANMLISNFWDSFTNSVVVSIDGDDITIANQEPDNDDFTISGSGTYSNGTISFSYTITDEGTNDTDVCTSTWTKQ